MQQRVTCWRPLRRWLQHTGRPVFPTEAEHFLDYLEVKEGEGGSRSTATSLLAALRFLEEAGEVQAGNRLSADPALANAAREAKATPTAAQKAGARSKKRQAPPMLLVLLAALEDLVVDPSKPLYLRAFAWYRLFRHWASLRWDDTQALLPASLRRMARGVVGTLERTKTSGHGKAQQVLPVFVSDKAFLRTPWLDAGLVLWLDGDLAFPRDYFLPLPNPQLDGCLRRRALYTDSAGFSVALLSSLADGEGNALLPAGAARYWTEHSDRSGLDGWCATLGFDESSRGFLGRWAAKGSADTYVRTALRVCENLQKAAITHARRAFNHGPDFFGEEQVLSDYRVFLLELGLSEAEAELAEQKLTAADFDLDPTVALNTAEAARAPVPELLPLEDAEDNGAEEDAGSPTVIPSNCSEDEAGESGQAFLTPLAVPAGEPTADEAAAAAAAAVLEADFKTAAAAAAPAAEVPWGFVVSKTRNGRHRSLHHVGCCWRVPGVHYREFDIWGDVMPPEASLNSKCKDCFATGGAGAVKELEPEAGDEEAGSSSSSSSSGSQPPAKKPKPESAAAASVS